MRNYVGIRVLAGWAVFLAVAIAEQAPAAEPVANVPIPTPQIAYDGWVHVQARKLETEKPEDSDEHDDPNAKPPEMYFNQARGVLCSIMDFGNRKLIRLQSSKTGHMVEYDSQFDGVAFGNMNPELIKKVNEQIMEYPLTLKVHIATLKKAGAIFLGSNEVVEKNLLKVTVAYVGGKNCSTCPEDGGLDILWIDPKTNLIQKLQTQMEHPQEITFTYDKKEQNEIYDFGAPRNAKISDSRPSPEAARILKRFDKHHLDGLGDFVAVLTETDHRKEWGTKKMFLYLYAQEKDKLVYAVYDFNPAGYPDSPLLNLSGWPKVDIKQILDLAKKTIPLTYYATDGTSAWIGRFDTAKENKSRLQEGKQPLKDLPPLYDYFLVYHFWRNQEALFLYGYGPKADTLADNDHPGLVGLRLREGDFTPAAKNTAREEWTFWIDPQRNDLPVHYTHSGERITDKPNSLTRFDTRFVQFAQLPNGTWYPTHWKTRAAREDFLAKTKGGYDREFLLQVVPGMKLESGWYTSRANALGIEPAKMVLKEQKKK